jgi:hypothetical protein
MIQDWKNLAFGTKNFSAIDKEVVYDNNDEDFWQGGH